MLLVLCGCDLYQLSQFLLVICVGLSTCTLTMIPYCFNVFSQPDFKVWLLSLSNFVGFNFILTLTTLSLILEVTPVHDKYCVSSTRDTICKFDRLFINPLETA